jgi:AcrR family transcriptional regulator
VESLTESLARRSVEQTVAERRASYEEEIRDLLDAAFRVIQKTGTFVPTMRDLLRESGLSTQAFYKHFRSKDELLLLLLDDGRRKLVGYLEHRMDKASTPAGRVRAWIEGVLAQARNREAAARTRPFLANRDRLAEQFPKEQQASMDLLVDLLAAAIVQLPGRKGDRARARRDAEAIYDVTFGAVHRYVTHRRRPSAAEIDHVVRFGLAAVGAKDPTRLR